MVVPLIASALLLDFLGCMMPLALVEDTKAFKAGVFLIWAALVADSVLMGFIDFLVTAVGYVSLLLGTIWLIFF